MRKFIKTMLLIIASILFAQCANMYTITTPYKEYIGNEYDDCSECDNRAIIAVLKDEPAYVKKSCYRVFGKKHSFMIVLANRRNIELTLPATIYPCGGVPEEFQVDGFSVLITGNIL